jgi:hypothetical protein
MSASIEITKQTLLSAGVILATGTVASLFAQKVRIPDVAVFEVVSRPAALLGANFEPRELAADMAERTAEESVKDAGALPLLSYLLDDMWTAMVKRGDGKLRLPRGAIEIGVERADAFLATHLNFEDKLRRIFTLKLATVREGEEPTRRRAPRSEFSEEEWRLVTGHGDGDGVQ